MSMEKQYPDGRSVNIDNLDFIQQVKESLPQASAESVTGFNIPKESIGVEEQSEGKARVYVTVAGERYSYEVTDEEIEGLGSYLSVELAVERGMEQVHTSIWKDIVVPQMEGSEDAWYEEV